MRIRTVLCATALAGVAAFPLAGAAAAQEPTDRDCRDFASQAAAQSALRSHSGDPERLDVNHNGIACEEYFKTALPAPPEVPRDGEPAAPPVRPVVDRDREPGSDRPDRPGSDRPDGPGRPDRDAQVPDKPHGPADTGDGSAAASSEMVPAVPVALPVAVLVGGLGAVGFAGARRRAARR